MKPVLRRHTALIITLAAVALSCNDDRPLPVAPDPDIASAEAAFVAPENALFSDGFDDTVLAWDSVRLKSTKSIVAEAARSGASGLRVTYPSGSGAGTIVKLVTPGTRLYARAAVRLPATWNGGMQILTLRAARPAINPWASIGYAGNCPSGYSWAVTSVEATAGDEVRFHTYFPGMTRNASGGCSGSAGLPGEVTTAAYHVPLQLSKGDWHVVELEAQLNTVGQADGWQKMWLDGELKAEWTGLAFRSSNSVVWNAVSLDLTAFAVSGAQIVDFDEVVVMRERPEATLPPPPPPPPPPPSPTSVPAETLFVEGFESGALGAWDDNVGAGAHGVAADAARSGSQGLRVTMNQTDNGGMLTKFVTRGERLYVRASVRFPANWTGATELVRLRAAPAAQPWASFGKTGQCPSGTDWASTNLGTTGDLDLRFLSSFTGMQPDGGGQCWGYSGQSGEGIPGPTYTPPLSVPKGDWHTIEFEAQLNTAGNADGWQRVWLDGTLKGEWTGLRWRSDSALQWNAVSLDFWSTGVTQSQSVDIDDIVVLTSRVANDSGPTNPPPPPPPPPPPAQVARIVVNPATAAMLTGASVQLSAALEDSAGNALSGRPIAWQSSATSVATVDTTGRVSGVAVGSASIIASSEGKSDTAAITVTAPAPAPVATVQVTPASGTTNVGGTIQFSATLRDSAGTVLTNRSVTWSSGNQAIAVVNTSGLVTGQSGGTTSITATSEGQNGTAGVTVTAPPPPPSGEPVYSAANPDHKLHVYEDWSRMSDISQLGSVPRADGGSPWINEGIRNYGAVVNETDGFGSARHLTTDYDRDAPIPPHGTGAHAAGYHWYIESGDDNAVGGGKNNRGLILGQNSYLNKPAKASVVYEWAIRYRGTNWYEGKTVDINPGYGWGVGRFNFEPFNAALGWSGNCTDAVCTSQYSGGGYTPRFPGLPPTFAYTAPNITRTQTVDGMPNVTIWYKQNAGWGTTSGTFSWGRGGDNVPGAFNADLRGTNTPMWQAGWLYYKLQITKQAPGQGFGNGRIEMWIGHTPGALLKVMDYIGDVGGKDAGLVYVDPTGTSDQLMGDVHFFGLASRRYKGGGQVDIGTVRIWSHSR